MLRRLRRRGYQPRTLGADKGYDTGRFPHEVLALGIEPHIAVNEHASRTWPARRFVKHRGYKVSQRIRKRVEEARDPMASSTGQWWALDIAVSVPVAVPTARMLAVALSVLVVVPGKAKDAVGMA